MTLNADQRARMEARMAAYEADRPREAARYKAALAPIQNIMDEMKQDLEMLKSETEDLS
jgi:hypothetical protein